MSQVRLFRMVALAEGVSFPILLGIAMPMKYFMGMPGIVRVVGLIHGVLFLVYVGLLARIHERQRWPLRFSLQVFVAAIIPFGTVLLDKHLCEKELAVNYSEGKILCSKKIGAGWTSIVARSHILFTPGTVRSVS